MCFTMHAVLETDKSSLLPHHYRNMVLPPLLMHVVRDLVLVHGLSIREIRDDMSCIGLEQADVLTALEIIFDLATSVGKPKSWQNVRRLLLGGANPHSIALRLRTGEEEIRGILLELEGPWDYSRSNITLRVK
jgi:cell division protein ZapA (FtsZ GTPase activity inhibitor)